MASSGTIGLFHDWFIGPFPEMIMKYSYDGLQLYDVNLGNKEYPSDWLFRISLFPFSFLGGEVVSKGMLIFFLTLTGISMFYLGKTLLKLDYYWSLIGGLIYTFSPIVYTRAVAGHIYYLIGYSLMPLLLTIFHKAQQTKEKRIQYSIISGFLFGVMGIQIHFFVMALIILLPFVLLEFKNLKNSLLCLTLTILIGLSLHLPWLLPMVLTPSTSIISATRTFLSYHEIVASPTLLESIRVIGYKIHPYSYTNLIAQGIVPSWILITNFLMPVIATLTIIWKKNRYTIGFGLLLTIGIFLSKGINPPFETLFIFLFEHTPLIIFRELWHITFLVFFSYTVLTLTALHQIFKSKKQKLCQIKAYILTISLTAIIIISNGYPLFLGNLAGYMQTYSLSNNYHSLYQNLKKDNDQYRILWLPSIAPMKYNNKSLFGVDPLIQYSPKPTFQQLIMPQYPISRLTLFLTSTIKENKTNLFGNLISPFATKYIILRKNVASKYPIYVPLGSYPDLSKKWEPYITNNFIVNQQDLWLKNETSDFKLYQNKNPVDFMYTPITIVYGTKDLSTLTHLAKILNLTEIAYLTDMNQLKTDNPIFVIKDDGLDLIPMVTGIKIDPGKYTTETDAHKGWINSKNWFWYNYLFASTINNGAFTKTKSQLEIPVRTESASEIWVKLLMWPNGGKIKFKLNTSEKSITTLSSAFSLKWEKIFEENSNQTHTLTIYNVEGENYIDEVLVINKEETNKILSKLENITIIYLITPSSFETNIVKNPSFEKMEKNYPLYWSLPEKGFISMLDNQTRYKGKTTLKVTTQLDSNFHWSWIRSSEIPVTPGKYQIITHVKQKNVKQSHIAIEGLNRTTSTWI
ncbi:MAG: hypothetical protein ACTSYN_04445, partial [Candidatus Heimdallarchaeaceae archaeon]